MLPLRGEERRRSRATINMGVTFNCLRQNDAAASLLDSLLDDLLAGRRHLHSAAWTSGQLVLALTQLGRMEEAQQRLRQALIDAAPLGAEQREHWRREGEALDEAGVVALCLGESAHA